VPLMSAMAELGTLAAGLGNVPVRRWGVKAIVLGKKSLAESSGWPSRECDPGNECAKA